MRRQIPAFGTGSQAGFTLLELLVVLVIAASLTSLLAIRFPVLVEKLEARTAARRLAMDLRSLRHAAIAASQNRSMTLSANGAGYSLEGLGERTFPATIRVRPETPDGNGALMFMPDGSAQGDSLLIGADMPCCRIAVDRLTGKVAFRE